MTGNIAPQALLAVLCLGAVLLLILGAARLARSVPALRTQAQGAGGLSVSGMLALDRQRRLHLVEAGGRHALILTGGVSDVMIVLPAET